ncbi:hypothetical protein V6N13_038668 [Hibiscus sabdariffa]|uniref:Uncharacterized protein n=1 Tax=Hibiscus sabdariffa TaxID=183260 RepID=A0ABR2B9B3_9ROSI
MDTFALAFAFAFEPHNAYLYILKSVDQSVPNDSPALVDYCLCSYAGFYRPSGFFESVNVYRYTIFFRSVNNVDPPTPRDVTCINVGKPNSIENQIPEDDRQEEQKPVDSENLASKDRQENGSNWKIHAKPPNDDNEIGGKAVEVTHIQSEL